RGGAAPAAGAVVGSGEGGAVARAGAVPLGVSAQGWSAMTFPAPDACALGIRDETLSAWRDGLAPAAMAQRLEAHVAGCAACGARLGAFDAVRRTLLTQR